MAAIGQASVDSQLFPFTYVHVYVSMFGQYQVLNVPKFVAEVTYGLEVGRSSSTDTYPSMQLSESKWKYGGWEEGERRGGENERVGVSRTM